jgi:3-hydroxybutyryl-CoA dehydrogenase
MELKIGILGSGTMGAGIAQVAAFAGCSVTVYDQQEAVLAKAKENLQSTLSKLEAKGKITHQQVQDYSVKIQWSSEMQHLASSNLIIEAIVEKLEIKQQVFVSLEQVVSQQCILASNTSSLSITSIAAACQYPERVIGIHFFNPAPLMELVEIIPALQTQPSATQLAIETITSWGKKVVVAKDTPGFIVNRIARPYYSEAIRLYEEGKASIATIDYAMKTHGGFRMGPFELMDLIGHDVNYAVTESVWTAFYFDPRYTPSFSQKRLVEAKWLGRKTGRGFYNYAEESETPEINSDEVFTKQLCNRIILMLINEAANALYLNVASREDIDTAMTKGVNYPKGLLHWADEWGIDVCVEELDLLYAIYHEDRYRCSPLLRHMQREGKLFYE